MFDIGMQELIVIFVVILLVFGPKRAPELGRAVGKGLAELRRAIQGVKEQVETEFREDMKTFDTKEAKKTKEEITELAEVDEIGEEDEGEDEEDKEEEDEEEGDEEEEVEGERSTKEQEGEKEKGAIERER